MDPKFQEQLDEQEIKINEILKSVKKMENYMKLTFWATIVVVVLPFIIFLFALPAIMRTLTSSLSGFEGLI
jgi:type II secretory pathway component PulF